MRCLPVTAIEQLYLVLRCFEIKVVKATNVYGIRYWVRPRIAKNVDAAALAKEVFGDLLVELVYRQFVRTLQQFKPLRRDIAP